MTAQTTLGRVIKFLAGSPARRFASISVVLAIVASIAPTKDLFSEWRYYQRQYKQLIRHRPDGARLQKNFQGGIQQIWIPERHVTDRCSTCHVALQENSLADQRKQPFRPHPPMPHTLNEFGCVICHNGQGAATTVTEAHYSTKEWEQPILPTRYLEASCGQCHMEPLEGTPQLNLGRRLLARYGCAHCHAITQPDGSRIMPVDEPPSLEHIGEKTSREWIFSWLKNPQVYAVSSTMPNFRFSDQEATDIANFLVSQSDASVNSTAPAPASFALPPAEQAAVDGPGVYGMLFCASCHATQNSKGALLGGELAPEITRVGSKVKVDWLRRWLKAPQGYDPKTRMPRYRFDDKQIAMLTAYLLTKKDEDLLANVHLDPSDRQSVERGKKLATDYGCAACHRINGIAPPEGFAPDLSRIGSKPLFQVGFLRGMPETLPDYISGKIRDPRAFGPALKMPRFTLDDSQVEALTTALLAQTDRAVTMPPELVRSVPLAKYHPGGDTGRLMEDLRCQSCHSINGNGGEMAPDLTREGSAVQRGWLLDFMKNPDTLRPALIRRMPKFNLSDEEIHKLSDYMLNAYQAPGFDSEALDLRSLDAGAAARGRELFYTKYACQACHIADYKKDKGYVGPALADVGDRLTPVWMYKWLKDPNAVAPGTVMPNPRLADKEAKDLTAFLVTLRAKKKGGAK
ncbi:MAG TPA: c-type cytochrome [Candidatus Acidoferrum sp.]|nr:c-type cytochrome [Candidatus Acidoferrum sp.]